MVILGLLVFTITSTMWIAKSEQRRTWLVFLVITMICAAIVIAAPGNAVRSSNFPIRHRLFFSLKESLLQEARFLIIWLSNPVFILGTIFFVPIADRLSDKISALKSLAFHPLVSSLVLLTIVFLGCFPVYWATGSMGQLRTMNVAYFFFLIGWFINIVIWVDYLKRKRGFATAKLPHYVYVIGVPLLFCTLLFSNNMKTAIADLVSGRAYHYDKAVKERYAQFRQCVLDGHLDDCPVVTISDLPATITNPYYETEFDCQKLYWKLEVQSSGRR